jgi:hypothetical protein
VAAAVFVTFLTEGVILILVAVHACVTSTVTGAAPGADTMIDAVLEPPVKFSVKVAISVPLPLPVGVTVHHVSVLKAVHVVFVVTENNVVPATDATDLLEGVTDNNATVPA